MDDDRDILKNTPEYEEYDFNEVKLTLEEMRELGLLKCSGKCCNNKKSCGNSKQKCCCNKEDTLKLVK